MIADAAVADAMGEIISEVLGVDREQVTPQARWSTDLGGESLDLLDLAFRAEKKFGVKVPINGIIGPGDLDEHARLKPTSADRLRQEYPDVDFAALFSSDRPTSLLDIVTVGMLTSFVQRQIASQPG